jgi:polyferredoxin
MQNKFTAVGVWLGQHQRLIRRVQWAIILLYLGLMIIPVFLPLPDDSATLFHNLTVFAAFLFWGIWWPFVLLSIIFFGRLWCGILCPEGALSEIANQYGRGKRIPAWMRWGGWPFVAFGLTTIYGQLISVYQYPKPVILILGGSTLAAILIGFLYGKSNRVWCKYLCPVTGVFSLLSKLAPFHFQPNQQQWNAEQIKQLNTVHCPTLLPLPKMTSSANCLMCGKCANVKEAIQLKPRSMQQEVIKVSEKNANIYESLLIIYGLGGIALAAFQWTNSFWFQHFRTLIESWLLVHNIEWAFKTNAPWWILTNYPEQGDVFSWIYGIEILSYILIAGFIFGSTSAILIGVAVTASGEWTLKRFNHLSQSLIPLLASSIFIGLLANTFTMLQKYANLGFLHANYFKGALLFLSTGWSSYLAFNIIKQQTSALARRCASFLLMFLVFALIDYCWFLTLYIWSVKSDSVPWNILWI